MGTHTTMAYCQGCETMSPHLQQRPNHLLHLLLTLLTGGLWLIVWLFKGLEVSSPQCMICGVSQRRGWWLADERHGRDRDIFKLSR